MLNLCVEKYEFIPTIITFSIMKMYFYFVFILLPSQSLFCFYSPPQSLFCFTSLHICVHVRVHMRARIHHNPHPPPFILPQTEN